MELIGGGRASQVFALDERTVLRRSGFDVSGEVRLMRHLRAAGFPVPEVFASDGGDLTMRRLYGGTLGAEVTAGRIGVPEAAQLLLDLHDRLHTIDAPDWLPTARRGLDLAGLDLADPDRVGPGPAKVLHLDLHPENVIVTDGGPYLVDWTNAAAGAPELDLAVSWAILAGIDLSTSGTDFDWLEAVRGDLLAVFSERVAPDALALAVAYREADPNVDPVEAQRLRRALPTGLRLSARVG